MSLDLTQLKAKQDALDVRIKALWPRVEEFREGLVDELNSIATEAQLIGLRGITPCEGPTETGGVWEISLTIAEHPVLIVGNEHLYFRSLKGKSLCSKLRLYHTDGRDDHVPPAMEIELAEAGNDAYRSRLSWFSAENKNRLCAVAAVGRSAGREIAQALVKHLYDVILAWTERPDLWVLRDGSGHRGELGFLAER